MKKMFKALLLSLTVVLAACGGQAHAAPTYVVDASGATSFPTEPALSIEKNTDSGNRVKVKYPSGFQFVVDDAAWTKYALLLAGLSKPVAVPTSTTGLRYDMAKGFGGCDSQGSYVSWPNVGQPEHVYGDGCAFWQAVKANSN